MTFVWLPFSQLPRLLRILKLLRFLATPPRRFWSPKRHSQFLSVNHPHASLSAMNPFLHPQSGLFIFTLQPNQCWKAKHHLAFLQRSLSPPLVHVSKPRLVSLCVLISLPPPPFGSIFCSLVHKWKCLAWLINAGSYIAQKYGALCAPSVHTGSFQEPRLWNSYYYWAGPSYCWTMKT